MMNVIFVGLLAKTGYEILIKENYYNAILNDIIIFYGQMKHDIYTLSWPMNVMYTTNKRPKIDKVNEIYLWHYRLRHINKIRINRLTQQDILEINDCESLSTYESSLLGKITKSPFSGKGERASDVLKLRHIDVCGLMNISARDGYVYFITFIDDLSRYGYVYLMKRKSESFEIFKQF